MSSTTTNNSANNNATTRGRTRALTRTYALANIASRSPSPEAPTSNGRLRKRSARVLSEDEEDHATDNSGDASTTLANSDSSKQPLSSPMEVDDPLSSPVEFLGSPVVLRARKTKLAKAATPPTPKPRRVKRQRRETNLNVKEDHESPIHVDHSTRSTRSMRSTQSSAATTTTPSTTSSSQPSTRPKSSKAKGKERQIHTPSPGIEDIEIEDVEMATATITPPQPVRLGHAHLRKRVEVSLPIFPKSLAKKYVPLSSLPSSSAHLLPARVTDDIFMTSTNIPSSKKATFCDFSPFVSSPTPPPAEMVLKTYKKHALMPLTPEGSDSESLTPPEEPTEHARPFDGYPWWLKALEQRLNGLQIHINNMDLKQVCEETFSENYEGLHKVHTFTQIDNFVVMGNINTSNFHIPNDKTYIALAGRDNAVVVLTPGMVTSSSVIRAGPAPSKGGMEAARNKNICIAPLSSALRKTIATLSDIMNVTTLQGPVKPDYGLIFQTLPQKKVVFEDNQSAQKSNGAFDLQNKLNQMFKHNAASSSPATTPNGVPIPPSSAPTPSTSSLQPSRFIKTVQTNTGPIGMDYPMYQPCEAVIPIYDGRASTGTPFTFTYDDFANLKQRRRYEGGLFDLAHEDLVVFVILMNSKVQSTS
ncbi:hypothetical protein BDN72DRAFT_906633 [Pluteus cervinus]|uniref:Uncharacterized protein n=1 Tax=Pluteus cervinus TaxID=181527 RepID=A0ACD2ZYQ3_9AGAR|nr:hypothetical protein BDN72DRAFT_906633 [Pluteus cervinus]